MSQSDWEQVATEQGETLRQFSDGWESEKFAHDITRQRLESMTAERDAARAESAKRLELIAELTIQLSRHLQPNAGRIEPQIGETWIILVGGFHDQRVRIIGRAGDYFGVENVDGGLKGNCFISSFVRKVEEGE